MLNIIVELSKYLILIIMLLYTLESFLVFRYEEDYDQRYILRKQLLLIIFLDLTAFLVIFLQTEELKVLYLRSPDPVSGHCPGIIQGFV